MYFLGTIVRRNYLPKISTVGLFSCDIFEENPKQKVINLSKLNEFYFRITPTTETHFQFKEMKFLKRLKTEISISSLMHSIETKDILRRLYVKFRTIHACTCKVLIISIKQKNSTGTIVNV